MLDLADALFADPPRPSEITADVRGAQQSRAVRRAFTMHALRRLTLWGATAACALFAAALTSRSEVGLERIAGVLHSAAPQQVAARSFDAETATRRLDEQLRSLAANDEQIKTRLAAVEHDLDDVTGSISKQIEAATASSRTDDGPTVAATAALSTAIATSAPADAPPQLAMTAPAEATADAPRGQYGVDIGAGMTMDALWARWVAIRSMRPQLFEGLQPIVSVKEIARGNRMELRLIAGPFPQAAGAAQLCTELSQMGLYCQPTMFDGQHLTQRKITAVAAPAVAAAKRTVTPPPPAHPAGKPYIGD